MKAAKRAVVAANGLTEAQLQELLLDHRDGKVSKAAEGELLTVTLRGAVVSLQVLHAGSLRESVRDAIFGLFERNMKTFYERSSQGWKVTEKHDELFDSSSRFIVARRHGSPDGLLGFVMFRFDTEECEEDDPAARKGQDEIEVVYCYELQIAQEARGSGLGRVLTETLETLGRGTNMRKSMLTCFLDNEKARGFYSKVGYSTDLICPSMYEPEDGEEAEDYTILSKSLLPDR